MCEKERLQKTSTRDGVGAVCIDIGTGGVNKHEIRGK